MISVSSVAGRVWLGRLTPLVWVNNDGTDPLFLRLEFTLPADTFKNYLSLKCVSDGVISVGERIR